MAARAKFDVRCTPRALAWIEDAYRAAESAEGGIGGHTYQATNARYLRRVLEEFVPEHALNQRFAIGEGLFRAKGARWRLVWAASSQRKAAVVLLIGYRKEGDPNDVYRILGRILATDEFDATFRWLGMTKPQRGH